MDASVGFMPLPHEQVPVFAPVEGTRGMHLIDYQETVERHLRTPAPEWKRFPSVMVGWDNTARRPYGATLYHGATPDAYERWLRRTVERVARVPDEENFVFLLAWNEWAEGNHLEPDQMFGRAWLEATRAVLVDGADRPSSSAGPTADAAGPLDDYDYVYDYQHESAVAKAAGLVRDLLPDRASTVVDLGAGSGIVSLALRDTGIGYHGLEIHPVAVDLMHERGIEATRCDVTDIDQVLASLEPIADVGAFLLLDVLEHLLEPQKLLSALSAWAMEHDEPFLVVSVPNVAHFDIAFRLLCGKWIPPRRGCSTARTSASSPR